MKGIILAGGNGSRLYPLTQTINKCLLPIGKDPMIVHSIRKLVECGITDIMIITGTDRIGDVLSFLGSGKRFDCSLTYRVQDEADGIASALYLAKDFAKNDSVTVILGDNIFEDSIASLIDSFNSNDSKIKCALSLKSVKDPERFGVAEVSNGKILSIEEKPQNPKSSYCITGIYIYDKNVFDYISTLEPSARGEYEITDVNNCYIRSGDVTFSVQAGWWTDAGTHDSYQLANRLVRGE